jgi:hypothetical protein
MRVKRNEIGTNRCAEHHEDQKENYSDSHGIRFLVCGFRLSLRLAALKLFGRRSVLLLVTSHYG